jgi:hypothetical protein
VSDALEREASESDVDHRFGTVDALAEEIVKFEWIDLTTSNNKVPDGNRG